MGGPDGTAHAAPRSIAHCGTTCVRAWQAIYRDAHSDSCMGLRRELSALIPADSQLVVDLGAGDGDGPAATARMLPGAKVLAVEASPFMIIAGRRQNRDCPNLEFRHALAENTHLQAGCADAVSIWPSRVTGAAAEHACRRTRMKYTGATYFRAL